MSTDQTDYEIFVSYARKDNRPIPDTHPHGWVTAVRDFIVADHRQYSADPMRIFFDTAEIRDMDDWRNRILGALRRSKVLLICLSPNYFASQPCRWEWDEFLARQAHKLVGSEPHATVYFVEVPGSDEQDNAKRLNAVMGSNFTDLRPWFPTGAAAMREEAVRGRMAVLGQSVWERISRARRALTVPGNLRAMTPYFLGRNKELADLHRLVGVGKIGLVAAVHGLGGQGKTELSVAYARGHADCYPLGLWALPAENEKELLPLLGQLAFKTEFGYAPTKAAKNDAATAGREVLAELQRRFDAAKAKEPKAEPAALVLLDNVSEPGLLAATQLSTLPKVDWLRIIATTRLDPKPLDPAGKAVGTVLVDALDPDTALRLIENHQPGERFRTAADEAAALEIVRELGGFTLAVEQVAVFLAVNPDVTPADYLLRLRAEGLHTTDDLVDDATVEQQIEHQLKRIRPVLEAMLTPLSPAARTLLGFASLLPPDTIPWPWLKELTGARHPELGQRELGYPDPWVKLRRQVEGLRFLTGSAESEFARMHRLVEAHLRQGVSAAMDEELRALVSRNAVAIETENLALPQWELDGVIAAIPHLLTTRPELRLALDGMFLLETILAYRNLPTAFALLAATHRAVEFLRGVEAMNDDLHRAESIALERLGDIQALAGQHATAVNFFDRSLAIRSALADADPDAAGRRRDVAVSHARLGDSYLEQRDYKAAGAHFATYSAITRTLAAEHPTDPEARRDVAVALVKLGDVSVAMKDLKAARGHYTGSLAIVRPLADAKPNDGSTIRDLSVALIKLGDVCAATGDWKRAVRHFEQQLAVAKRLFDADPTSGEKRRDLSVIYSKLGEASRAMGDLYWASRYLEEDLAIARSLSVDDPKSAQKQADVAVSLDRLAEICSATKDWTAAHSYLLEYSAITTQLSVADPVSAMKRRDVAISYTKLARLAEKTGDPDVLVWRRKCLDEFERMIVAELHVSPGDLQFVEQLRAKLGAPHGGGGV